MTSPLKIAKACPNVFGRLNIGRGRYHPVQNRFIFALVALAPLLLRSCIKTSHTRPSRPLERLVRQDIVLVIQQIRIHRHICQQGAVLGNLSRGGKSSPRQERAVVWRDRRRRQLSCWALENLSTRMINDSHARSGRHVALRHHKTWNCLGDGIGALDVPIARSNRSSALQLRVSSHFLARISAEPVARLTLPAEVRGLLTPPVFTSSFFSFSV